MAESKALALIRPKYYASENTLPSTGFTPRYFRSLCVRLGVTVYWPSGGRRWCVDADEFDAALKREREQVARPPIDEAEALRKRLGLVAVRQ